MIELLKNTDVFIALSCMSMFCFVLIFGLILYFIFSLINLRYENNNLSKQHEIESERNDLKKYGKR